MRQLVHRLNVSTLVTSLCIGRVQARSPLREGRAIRRLTFGSCQQAVVVVVLNTLGLQHRVVAVLVALRRSPLKLLGMLNTQSPSVLVVSGQPQPQRPLGATGRTVRSPSTAGPHLPATAVVVVATPLMVLRAGQAVAVVTTSGCCG